MVNMIYTEMCVGCRSCEIACSYHHRKIFSSRISSIEVQRFERDGKFGIVLHRQAKNGRMACDGCKWCLNYCPFVARDELESILDGRKVP